MRKMSLNQKLGSMVAVLWVGLILIAIAGVWRYHESLLQDRRDQLKSLVQQGESVAKHYYALSQQHVMTEEEAKKQTLETLKVMRYGEDGYFSINDSKSVMLMHPIKPQLIG